MPDGRRRVPVNPLWLATAVLVGMAAPVALFWRSWSRGRRIAAVALSAAAYPMALGRVLEVFNNAVKSGPPLLEEHVAPLLLAAAAVAITLPGAIALVRWGSPAPLLLAVPPLVAMLVWQSYPDSEPSLMTEVRRTLVSVVVLVGALAVPWALPAAWPRRNRLPQLAQLGVVALAALPLIVPGPGFAMDGLWGTPRPATHIITIEMTPEATGPYAFDLDLPWPPDSPWHAFHRGGLDAFAQADGAVLSDGHGRWYRVDGEGPATIRLAMRFYGSIEMQESRIEAAALGVDAISGGPVEVAVTEDSRSPYCRFETTWHGVVGVDATLPRQEGGDGECS